MTGRILLAVLVLASAADAQTVRPRARDLGIPFDGAPGPLNAITDVAGVEVGYTTEVQPFDPALRRSTMSPSMLMMALVLAATTPAAAHGDVVVSGDAAAHGDVVVSGDAAARGDVVVSGDSAARGDVVVSGDSAAIAALARQLRAGATTDLERARAIYGWIATNVTYDVASYLAGGHGDHSPEAVYRTRSAVCDGYANLFIRLAREMRIEAHKVPGYAKGFDHTTGKSTTKNNHAWVAFRIGRDWHLADPTWGAGHVSSDLQFVPAFTWWYFDVQPELLILSHYPEDRRWQRLGKALTRREFEQMATIPQPLRALGFSADALRRSATDRRHGPYPVANAADSALRVIRAPLHSVLSTVETYDFEIVWPGVEGMAVVVGEVWTRLTALGDGRYSGGVTPTAGPVMVAGQTAAGWKTLLLYEAR
ncbi:MAG TPA: transglutaminase domain-containing protein [Longimicrobiales bacterium]|nr:transglutaminase domain-containing protein [Longimicrobiales bacterium]